MKQKVQTLKGFRDFLPAEKRERDFVEKKLIEVCELFGFSPLETPTLEWAELLLGKYGQEADKLVYTFEDKGKRQVGLRYDQTVPTARILAQYREQLPKFFRRYQTQNVFRADKPQKGRYREFKQFDFDIFGSESIVADAEVLACSFTAVKSLGFKDVKLLINDRATLLESLEAFATKVVDVFSLIQTVDKLDKVGDEGVVEELVAKGLAAAAAKKALAAIKEAKPSENLSEILQAAAALGVPQESLIFTPTLARGLDYYTGMIFEVQIPQYQAGSCGGGGRYDKLISDLAGGPSIPAVGIALGFDRLVEAARELKIIDTNNNSIEVLVTIFSPELINSSLKLARLLRASNIPTEVYPSPGDKLTKQFKYASQIGARYCAVIGEQEAADQSVSIKNMKSGEQKTLPIDQTAKFFS